MGSVAGGPGAPWPWILSKGAGSTYNHYSALEALGGKWSYNWHHQPPSGEPWGIEIVPMIWSPSSIGKAIGGNSEWLMGFNEPGQGGQADITPIEGARAWRALENAYPDEKLVSPSCLDMRWLGEWYQRYIQLYHTPPRMDAIGVHWYFGGTYSLEGALASFKGQMVRADHYAASWKVPEVWVTEFALYPCWAKTGGMADAVTFLIEAHNWLAVQPRISRSAWFQVDWKNDGSEDDWAPDPALGCYAGLVDYYTAEVTPLGGAFRTIHPPQDVNRDGKIDILDMVQVGSRYGANT
jgi:hypothetical protein